MEHFPVIHTNFWDAVIAVPAVLVATQIIKLLLPIPRVIIPTIATILGLMFSLFIAHRFNFWGLFSWVCSMGMPLSGHMLH